MTPSIPNPGLGDYDELEPTPDHVELDPVLLDGGDESTDTAPVSVHRIALGTGLQLVIRLICAALGALSWAIISRKLGPANFGVFALILSLLSLGQNISDFGTTTVGIREMAQRPKDRSKIFAGIIGIQFVLGTTMFLILSVVGIVILHSPIERLTSAIVFFSLIAGVISEFQAVAQARLRPGIAGFLLFSQTFGLLAVVGILALSGASLIWYGIGWLIAGTVQGIVSWLCTRHLVQVDWSGWLREAFTLFRQSALFGLSVGLFLTYYKLDSVIVFYFKGAAVSGYYAAAYRFIDVVQFIPVTISSIVTPLMSMMLTGRGTRGAKQEVYALAIVVVTGLGGIIALEGYIFRTQIIHLVYGSAYSQSAALLGVLVLVIPSLSIGYVIMGIVNAGRQVLRFVIIAAAVAVANIVANLILVPHFGAIGAAWVAVATELVAAIGLAVLVGWKLRLRYPIVRSVRVALAIGLAGLSGIFARKMGLFLGGFVVAVAFGAGSICFGGIRIAEIRSLLKPGRTINA